MTSTEVVLPEASLRTNLEGCGFARSGGDIERVEAVAVFPIPVVRLKSASVPSAVFWLA
jgi:hypothetical protein